MDTLPAAGLAQLREILQRFVSDSAALDEYFAGAPFLEAITLDSLSMLHLITEIEKSFGVRFDLRTLEQVFLDLSTLSHFLAGNRTAA